MKHVRIYTIVSLILLLLSAWELKAQKLEWSVDFDYFFDNSEFDRSLNLSESSGTFHAARLTPRIGLYLPKGEKLSHRIMLGVDLYKDIGTATSMLSLMGEPTLYYHLDARFRNNAEFTAVAGAFPRKFLDGEYYGSFFDEVILFEDNNIEGCLFKYKGDKIFTELALDWMGKLADEQHPERRERFSIISHGMWEFIPNLSFGWTGHFYHFACSKVKKNVIDNHAVFPYLEYTPKISWLDELHFDIGPIISYQRDRSIDKKPIVPLGLQFIQKFSVKGFFLENWLYYGETLQPYYYLDEPDLYVGEAAYRLLTEKPSAIDCLALGYSRQIGDYAKFMVGAAFHFGAPIEYQSQKIGIYRGCQQCISLSFEFGSSQMRAAQKREKREKRERESINIFDLFGI